MIANPPGKNEKVTIIRWWKWFGRHNVHEGRSALFICEWHCLKGNVYICSFHRRNDFCRDSDARGILDYSKKYPTFSHVKVVIWIDIKSQIIFLGLFWTVVQNNNFKKFTWKFISPGTKSSSLPGASEAKNEHTFTPSSGKNTYPSRTGKWNLARLNC